MKLLVLFMIAICQLSDHRERVQLRAGSRFAYVPSSSLFDLARSLVLSIFIYGTCVLFPLFYIFSPVTASSYSPLVPNLYSIQLASRSENPSSRQFMSSIPAPPDANGNPLIALAVAVIYAILYVLQGVRYGVSLLTIGIPR